jgi:hypothetical protein
MSSKKNNGKGDAYPTAEEIFDKPPAPAGPLPPAWEDDSVAGELANERAREIISAELDGLRPAPSKKKAPPPPKKTKIEQAIENALLDVEQARIVQIQKYPEQRWAVHGIIPEGCTFIAGPPKLGKSIFCLNIAVAVAEGGKALSYFDVERGAVLYLALEDSKRRIQKRLAQLVTTELSDRLEIATKWPRLNAGGLEALEAWVRTREDPRLLIIDTFKMLRPLRIDATNHVNPYDIDYADVQPLTEFAVENRISLLIVTHTRKLFADDPLATVSGSFGLTGAADGVLVISRQRNNRQATLMVIGRDVEEQELALEFTPDIFSWAVLGENKSVRRKNERRDILDVLKESDEPLAPRDIADFLAQSPASIRAMLLRMRKDGEIGIFGKKYHLPEHVPKKKQLRGNGHEDDSDLPF